MLSMHDNEQYLFEALKAGASGYVLKSAADRDLVEACRAALRGEPFLYPSAVAALIRDFLDRARDGGGGARDPLTPRELQVVKLIAEAHTNAQIAERAADQRQDGRAPSRERAGQARDARPRRADALRDPPRARRAVGPAWGRIPRRTAVGRHAGGGWGERPMDGTPLGARMRRCGPSAHLLDPPQHLSAARPTRGRAPSCARCAGLPAVERAELTPLRTRVRRAIGRPYDWMLELHLHDGVEPSTAWMRRPARSGSATCTCSGCGRSWWPSTEPSVQAARVMAVAVVIFAGRARADRHRARRPHEGRAARRRAAAAHADDRPGGRDRGDRLEHARAARRDDADGPGHRADRRLHVAGDPRRPALARPAARGRRSRSRRPRRCCRRSWTT